jgi:hypothetical protein
MTENTAKTVSRQLTGTLPRQAKAILEDEMNVDLVMAGLLMAGKKEDALHFYTTGKLPDRLSPSTVLHKIYFGSKYTFGAEGDKQTIELDAMPDLVDELAARVGEDRYTETTSVSPTTKMKAVIAEKENQINVAVKKLAELGQPTADIASFLGLTEEAVIAVING